MRIAALSTILLRLSPAFTAGAQEASPLGQWRTIDDHSGKPRSIVEVYAASDGKVLAVERLRDERFGDEEWLRIVVFLSILDVHVNRAPIAGKVLEIVHEEGGFASANTRAAAIMPSSSSAVLRPRRRRIRSK